MLILKFAASRSVRLLVLYRTELTLKEQNKKKKKK